MVSVLNFFAEHPGQAFTFTDIVKALKLGRATCHALLAGLVEERYLYRNADKSYVIGPALVAIGKIANEQFSPLQAAQPEMRMLSDECHAACSAVYYEKGNAVIRSRAGSGSHLGWSVPQGYSLPLRAPFSAAFFSWTKPDIVEKWLDQLDPSVSEEERKEFYGSVEFTRTHGFSYGVANKEIATDLSAPELAFTGKQVAYPVRAMSDLDVGADYDVAFISSPVFDRQGRVEFVLNLSGFTGTMSGQQVARFGELVREAAERITYFITGTENSYPVKKSLAVGE